MPHDASAQFCSERALVVLKNGRGPQAFELAQPAWWL